LSAKLVVLRNEKQDVDEYVKKAKSTSKTSFGDVFGDALRQATNTDGSDNNN
jgi:hypothetical protein